jgi:hypothetical protein
MIGISLYHLYYILCVQRGKQLIRDLLPRPQATNEVYQFYPNYIPKGIWDIMLVTVQPIFLASLLLRNMAAT